MTNHVAQASGHCPDCDRINPCGLYYGNELICCFECGWGNGDDVGPA